MSCTTWCSESLANRESDVELGSARRRGVVLLRMDWSRRACRFDDVEARMQARRTWFQGRELANAACATRGARFNDGAVAQFYRALAMAETSDFYGAAWLIAECSDMLDAHDSGAASKLGQRFAPQVERQGYHG